MRCRWRYPALDSIGGIPTVQTEVDGSNDAAGDAEVLTDDGEIESSLPPQAEA